jgi:hypothetical protein
MCESGQVCMCTCVCIYVSVCATLVPCYLLVGEDYRVAAFVTCVRGFECVYVYVRVCAACGCLCGVWANVCMCARTLSTRSYLRGVE